MLDQLIEFARSASPEELGALWLEDVALCSAWFGSYAGVSEIQQAYQALGSLSERWLGQVRPVGLETKGRRQQPLLRRLVGQAAGGRVGSLRRDELDFLCAVYDVAENGRDAVNVDRLGELLGPQMKAVRARRDTLEPDPGLPSIACALHVVTSRDLQEAKPREVRTFAGIDLPGRGPVFSYTGDLKVLDHVPENCMVVVDRGSCCVGGYVMGRVAATGDCEVFENISGSVVVRQGDVRARSILNKAFVVAKSGSVICIGMQSPELVFAGSRIEVSDKALMGRYMAGDIAVGVEAFGGEYHVSRSITADAFRQSDARPLWIVLRRSLSCEDYGEIVSAEAARLMSKATRLQQTMARLQEMARLADRECEHFANSALMFLCGGDLTRGRIDEIESAQRRLAFLDRVIAGLQSLTDTAEENLAGFQRPKREPAEPGKPADQPEEDTAIRDVAAELSQLASEGEIDDDLSEEHQELVRMGERLSLKVADAGATSQILARLRSKRATWMRQRRELARSIEHKETELHDMVGVAESLDKGSAQASRVAVLRQLLVAAKKRPRNDRIAARVRAPFVSLMLRSIESRSDRVRKYTRRCEEVSRELRHLAQRLRQEYNLSIETGQTGDEAPRTSGRFGSGIRICSAPFVLEEANPPAGSLLITPDSRDAVKTYVREDHGIVEANCDR